MTMTMVMTMVKTTTTRTILILNKRWYRRWPLNLPEVEEFQINLDEQSAANRQRGLKRKYVQDKDSEANATINHQPQQPITPVVEQNQGQEPPAPNGQALIQQQQQLQQLQEQEQQVLQQQQQVLQHQQQLHQNQQPQQLQQQQQQHQAQDDVCPFVCQVERCNR